MGSRQRPISSAATVPSGVDLSIIDRSKALV